MLWKKIFILTVAILPFSFALNPTPEIDLSIVRVLFPLAFSLWLLSGLFKKELFLNINFSFLSFSIFLFFCALSFFWAPNKAVSLSRLLFLFGFFPLLFLVPAYVRPFSKKIFLVKILVWSSFYVSSFALFLFFLQFIVGIDTTLAIISKVTPFFLGTKFSSLVFSFPSWLVNVGGKTILRTFGSFPDPHLFSLFINMTLPLAFFLYKKTTSKRYLFLGATILLASLLSFSRAAYLSLFVGIFFYIFFFTKISLILKKHFAGVFFSLSFVFLLILTPNPFSQRLLSSFNPSEGSNSGRIEMWELAIDTTLQNPYFGVGIGNFAFYNFPQSATLNPIYAHNLFLDFSAEIGIFGTFFLILTFAQPILTSLSSKKLLSHLLAISLIIFIGHSFFETPFYSVRVFPLLLIILGLQTDA